MPQNLSFNPLIPKPAAGLNANPLGQAIGSISGVGNQPQCNIIWVDEMKNVLDHPTSPNEQMYFAEKGTNVIWVRETDGNGQVRNPLKKLVYSVEDVPFGPEANFVTKEEYQKLYDLVSNMSGKIENLVSQLN